MNRYEIHIDFNDKLSGRDGDLTLERLYALAKPITEDLEDRGHTFAIGECRDGNIYIDIDTKKQLSDLALDTSTIIRSYGISLPFGIKKK